MTDSPELHARSDDPWTSHEAIPVNLTAQARRVLASYRNGAALIDHDAYLLAGFGPNARDGQRCSDLRRNGLIKRIGEVARTPSGKSAHLCRITPAGYAFLDMEERKKVRQKTELRSYQQRVATHLYEHDEVLAVLKMGAGKTISTLTAIAELLDDGFIRHALIIAPKRVATMVWPAEIAAWAHTRHLKYAVLDGTPAQRWDKLAVYEKRDITIIGIDNVQWLVDSVSNQTWAGHPLFDCLVIDETSKLKDPKSKRAKALAQIAGRFKIKWGLTGTPAPNSLLDLFTPLKVLTNGRLWGKSFYKWRQDRFYPTDHNGYRWAVLPGQEDKIKAEAASVSITLGEGDMPDLPELSVLVDEVLLPDSARQTYRTMEKKLFAELKDKDVVAISQAVATGKLAQIANGFLYDEAGAAGAHAVHQAKEEWLRELVEQLEGEPVILVYEYKEDLAMLHRLFGDIPYLGAGVSDKRAEEFVKLWNSGRAPIFALHPASGGHGLNLQSGGSRMAWIGPTWSPELWDQTIARIHRPGQRNHVMVHVCCAAQTVDELKRMRVVAKLSAQAAFERYLWASDPVPAPAA